jgi:hypothetical protein
MRRARNHLHLHGVTNMNDTLTDDELADLQDWFASLSEEGLV